MRLIDADALMGRFAEMQKMGKTDGTEYACNFMSAGQEPSAEWYTIEDAVDNAPTVDAVPVVRCRECKHRPTRPEKYDDGFDLFFPDEACPCCCDDDPFYSWYPSDDWFCPRGERKGGDE